MQKAFASSFHVPRAIKNAADTVNDRRFTVFRPVFRLHERSAGRALFLCNHPSCVKSRRARPGIFKRNKNLLSWQAPGRKLLPVGSSATTAENSRSLPLKRTQAHADAYPPPCTNDGCRTASILRTSGHAAGARTQTRILPALTRAPGIQATFGACHHFLKKREAHTDGHGYAVHAYKNAHAKEHNGSARAKPAIGERERAARPRLF